MLIFQQGPDTQHQSLLSAGWSISRGLEAVSRPTTGSRVYPIPAAWSYRFGSVGSLGLVALLVSALQRVPSWWNCSATRGELSRASGQSEWRCRREVNDSTDP
ncbi:hypothetical protein DB88DRAFT_475796 [Papiliotrema laurentii]|nr:hypothetical protein DB88DRAFT_475796 [Papiliotrema laurentii]